MNRLTPAVLLAAALASHAAMAQTFQFNGGSGWLVRSTSAAGDLSFPDAGSNSTEMQYLFSDARLEGYQWGGSAYSAKNGRVQFSIVSNGSDNAPFGRVATAFSWAMDAWSADYGWAAIPSNRTGAMTGRNPANAPRIFASKVGDEFQMEVYASNYLTRYGWAQATAKIRNAPQLESVNALTTSMTDLSLLDRDPVRPGVQVLPGNILVHVTAGENIVSRSFIDFGSLGAAASPFRDSFYRESGFSLIDNATNGTRYGTGHGSSDTNWDPSEGTLQKSLGAEDANHLLSFTNADIGRTFTVRYTVTLRGSAYDADGRWVGGYTMAGPTSQSCIVEVVPTPGTIAIAGLGLGLSVGRRRRR